MIPSGSNRVQDTLTDSRLARQARAGSVDAFDALVHRHHEGVFGFLVSLTRHRQDAEDLTQETFLRAWRYIRRYDPARPLRPWLLTIARRQSIAALRKKKPIPIPDPFTEQHDPWQAAPDDSASRRLWALASKHLSPEARAALWLHYREDLPLDQVARVLGKRTGAVKTMLHRARRTLADAADRPPSTPPTLSPGAPPAIPDDPEPTPPPLPAKARHCPEPVEGIPNQLTTTVS